MDRKVRVLFLESQQKILSDSQVHLLLMRHYDRRQVDIHVACHPGVNGTKSASLSALETIPDLRTLATHFGPSRRGQSRRWAATDIASAPASFARLSLYVRQNHIDIIHAASRPRDAVYGVALGKLTGARSVIHLHVAVSDWFRPPMRWALHNCDAILGISDFVSSSALAAGYDATKIHTVRNGLDPARWDPMLDGTPVRQEFGITPQTPLLAVISRLFCWKGHSELFQALALVQRHDPNFRLLVVGDDDVHAQPGGASYRAELEALAGDLGLSDKVIFTGFRRDVARILAACDVYTMPSFEEPLGLAFLEAMAMRKPVVALRSGGVPEIVEHGTSGLLSAPGDIEGLAGNILTLIQDPPARLTMGTAGRLSVEQNHTACRMANATEEVYRRIMHATE